MYTQEHIHIYKHTHKHKYIHKTHIYTNAHIQIYIYTYTQYTQTHASTHTHTHTQTYLYTQTCRHMPKHAHAQISHTHTQKGKRENLHMYSQGIFPYCFLILNCFCCFWAPVQCSHHKTDCGALPSFLFPGTDCVDLVLIPLYSLMELASDAICTLRFVF